MAERVTAHGRVQLDAIPAGAQQSGQPPKAQKAYAGANTTDGTTNSSSKPDEKGGSSQKPNSPEASLCSDYQGQVQKDCLQIVTRNGPQPSAQGKTAGQGASK